VTSFFFSWVVITQLNHWTKWVNNEHPTKPGSNSDAVVVLSFLQGGTATHQLTARVTHLKLNEKRKQCAVMRGSRCTHTMLLYV